MRTLGRVALAMLALGVTAAPGISQTPESSAYRVDFARVPKLEEVRRLLEGCRAAGAVEPLRADIVRETDLERLRPALTMLGPVDLAGCPRRSGVTAGVLPLGGRLGVTPQEFVDGCKALEGATLRNAEDEYFGALARPVVADSIFNRAGPFGNGSSLTSIWNAFGVGGQLRTDSPWNPFSRGLSIIRSNTVLAYLTVNTTVPNWVHPMTFGAVCFDIADLDAPAL